ncbi:MAG: hypothetical protein SPL63_07675, partial [Roseburia faecis]|nr:hypothetical protein [Roseburia faecis]
MEKTWETFWITGKVTDYLTYRNEVTSDAFCDVRHFIPISQIIGNFSCYPECFPGFLHCTLPPLLASAMAV